MNYDEQDTVDVYNTWINDTMGGSVYYRKNIIQFKSTLRDIMDHLPLKYNIDMSQRIKMAQYLDALTDNVYLLNPVAAVGGFIAAVLAMRDNRTLNTSGALYSKHIEEVLDLFKDRVYNKEITAYDVIRYALVFTQRPIQR